MKVKVGDEIISGGKRGIVTCIDKNGVHVNFEGEQCSWGPSAPVVDQNLLTKLSA